MAHGRFGIGASVRRKEDFRFLTGQGTYTDDINRPGQLHAFLLRSPHAHAELGALSTPLPPETTSGLLWPGAGPFGGEGLSAKLTGGTAGEPMDRRIESRASWRSASSTGSRSVEGARSEPVIIALGEKVFGALLVITGAAIILTGHWTTTDDMIADLIAGGLELASGVLVLLMWSFQR